MDGKVSSVDCVSMDAGQFLKDVAHGSCAFEMTKGIENVVKAVRETKRKGKLELKLSFEPFKGDPNRIVVSYNVVEGAPRVGNPVSMFFSTARNTLSRRDPNQVEFPGDAGFPE